MQLGSELKSKSRAEGSFGTDLEELLLCPVCLDIAKPPLQVCSTCFSVTYSSSHVIIGVAVSRGSHYLWILCRQARITGVPPVQGLIGWHALKVSFLL